MPMTPEVAALVRSAAQRYGFGDTRPDYLPRIAQIESSGNPNARHGGSGASGLFQFIPSTARAYGLSNPFDPAASSDAAARLTLANEKVLRGALGRSPTDGELYLAHQQGSGGASKILGNPDATMGQLGLGKAASSNGGSPDMLARDFAGKWVNKVDGMNAPAPVAGGTSVAMPGASSAPAAFSLAGPAQPASPPFDPLSGQAIGPAPAAAATASAPDDTGSTLNALVGLLGGGKSEGSDGGQSQGDGGSMFAAPAPPRPRPFGMAMMRLGR